MNQQYTEIPQNEEPENLNNTTKTDFLDYNYNLYSSSMLLKWVKTQLNPNTSSLGDACKRNMHLRILNDLKEKIEEIKAIDTVLLDRKERSKDHFENLVLVNTALHLLNLEQEPTFKNLETCKQLAYTNQVQDFISYWNGHRLDMVWSRNFIEVMMLASAATLPALSRLLATVALVNGILSYGLYFLRGGLDVTKKVKHTVQEHDFYQQHGISSWERLAVQYKLRYARIINDVVLWGPVNLLTCHYLVGSGLLGNLGNGLTVFLLMGDLYMTTVVKSQFNHNFERLNRELRFKFGQKTEADSTYLNQLIAQTLSAEETAEFEQLKTITNLNDEETKKLEQLKEKMNLTAELAILNNSVQTTVPSNHLNDLLANLSENQKAINQDFDLVIAYQTALVASFSLIFVACLMTPLNMPLLIAGSVGCFLFQFLINLKDMYLRLQGEDNPHNLNAIYKEMFTRVLLQMLIPAAIISAGILVMPLMPTMSVWLMFGMCMTLAAIMVTLAEDLMSQYRLDAQAANLPSAPEKVIDDKLKDTLNNYIYQSQIQSYEDALTKHNDRQFAHLGYSFLAMSFMAGVFTISLSTTLLPVGISLMAGASLIAAIAMLSSKGWMNNEIGHVTGISLHKEEPETSNPLLQR